MMRLLFGKTVGFTLFVTLLLTSCSFIDKNETPPNIIVFLVDDMGLMDTSVPFVADSAGVTKEYPLNDFYKTPNMEKLALQGVRFTNFYAHSVCSPTRASIMTGQNAARHGTTNWILSESNNRTKYGPTDWNWRGLNTGSVTLPRLFQEAGYRTIHVGKAHFGPFGSEGEDPLNLGFDVNIAGSSIGHPGSYYGTDGYGHIKGQKARAVPGLEKYHGKEIFLTEALTLEAISAITQAEQSDQPFFLYMAHYAVHAPFQSDPRFIDNYKDSGKSDAANAYATLIEGIDKSLGDIMNHVKELGIGENTLILFLGDNGSDAPLKIVDGYSSSSPLKGKKGNHWEGGMRVPFIASWVTPNKRCPVQEKTKIAQNAVQTQIASIVDIFPSLSRLAGIHIPEQYTIDGFELQEQLQAKENVERKECFLNHFPHGNHRSNYFTSFVKSDWKIVYHYPIEGKQYCELFNLKNDPFERHDLSRDNREQLRIMFDALLEEMEEMGALYPVKDGLVLKPTLE